MEIEVEVAVSGVADVAWDALTERICSIACGLDVLVFVESCGTVTDACADANSSGFEDEPPQPKSEIERVCWLLNVRDFN